MTFASPVALAGESLAAASLAFAAISAGVDGRAASTLGAEAVTGSGAAMSVGVEAGAGGSSTYSRSWC